MESFALPITTYLRSHFLTARAAARRMIEQRSGAILMHTPEPARLGAPLVGGIGPAWAAMEALTRSLSAELAAYGVRAACLRSTGLPETGAIDVVFGLHSKALGIDQKQFLAMIESRTHRRRSTSLAELADVAVFLASDRANALTGTVVNLTGGIVVDWGFASRPLSPGAPAMSAARPRLIEPGSLPKVRACRLAPRVRI